MESVFINGLGLIGGSIAKIIKAAHPDIQISAYDPNQANLDAMLDEKVIDCTTSFAEGAQHADLIVLATPVTKIMASLKQLAQMKLKPNALVTDVGSNKERILKAAQPLIKNGGHFLGGHPMAGSHLSGSKYSSIDMFIHHTYFLVNGNATDEQIAAFKALLAPAHFEFNALNAVQHDQLVSATSHLPHVIAFTLINTIIPEIKEMNIDPGIPSGGLIDTTRIAKANPEMWASIMISEQPDILNQIDQFQEQLDKLKNAIKNQDANEIEAQIHHANHARIKMEDRIK